jgi:surface protein
MRSQATSVRIAPPLFVVLSLCACSLSAPAAETTLTRTNWVERSITNVIEVRMPLNRFVSEYHTNWVTEFRTNVINLCATNRLTRTFTNRLSVDVFRTNFVTAYQTNLKTLDLTNWQTAIVMKTNLLDLTLTNQVRVDAFRTNLVTAYQTNWKTLDLTNWRTAIVMKTNWVSQTITNVVQTDALGAGPAAPIASSDARAEDRTVTSSALLSAAGPCPFTLEVVRTGRPSNTGLMEVYLKIKGTRARTPLLHVLQWRVEREDRAVLYFGQEQEFKRDLPTGRYKVEVRIPQDGADSILTARGILTVSARDVLIEHNLAAVN